MTENEKRWFIVSKKKSTWDRARNTSVISRTAGKSSSLTQCEISIEGNEKRATLFFFPEKFKQKLEMKRKWFEKWMNKDHFSVKDRWILCGRTHKLSCWSAQCRWWVNRFSWIRTNVIEENESSIHRCEGPRNFLFGSF